MDMKKLLQIVDGDPAKKPAEGSNDMKKFISIINEGANPHKVSLPVQMAMNHYQAPVIPEKPKKESLLKKYFAEAEEAIAEVKAVEEQRIRQYSQKIAKKVLMKESELKDKEDLQAKRKALQDIQLDPHTSKDAKLKSELAYRKAALEKEAKKKGLSEIFDPEGKLSNLKKKMDADKEAQRQADMTMTPEKQAEIDDWAQGFQQNVASKFGKQVVPPKATVAPPVEKKPEETLDLATLQRRISILMKIEKLMQQKDKLIIRAGKFPGGLEPGIASDMEFEYGDPAEWSGPDYEAALIGFEKQVQKLTDYISRKRAVWSKPKTKKYMENAPGARNEAVIRKEIQKLQAHHDVIEHAYNQARKITTEIKYDDVPGDIMGRVRSLITNEMNIDMRSLEMAESEVRERETELHSAIYQLDDVFKDAVRDIQWKIDDLEGEIWELNNPRTPEQE